MKKLIILALIIATQSMLALATDSHRFAVGVNYPGVSFKYLYSEKLVPEFRFQMLDKIKIPGIRGNYILSRNNKIHLLTGLEADAILFTGEESEGLGFAVEIFGGVEYFVAKKLSLQMDLGPAWIYLNDKETSVNINALEFILNSGINYYW